MVCLGGRAQEGLRVAKVHQAKLSLITPQNGWKEKKGREWVLLRQYQNYKTVPRTEVLSSLFYVQGFPGLDGSPGLPGRSGAPGNAGVPVSWETCRPIGRVYGVALAKMYQPVFMCLQGSQGLPGIRGDPVSNLWKVIMWIWGTGLLMYSVVISGWTRSDRATSAKGQQRWKGELSDYF